MTLYKDTMIRGLKFTTKGSERSGNYGHAGRPGSVGGSAPGGGHHTAAGVVALGRMSPTSPIRSTTPLGEDQLGQNGAYLIEREDGSRGIFKPTDEMGCGDPDAEVLAYELSESLGWDFVPHTAIIEHEGKEGSVQRWVEDSKTYAKDGIISQNIIYREAGERMEVFDLLSGNDDRHGGNVIQDKTGNTWAIDNGFCFGFYEPGQGVSYALHPRTVPNHLKGSSALTELAQWSVSGKVEPFLDHLEETYGRGVSNDFIRNLEVLTEEVP